MPKSSILFASLFIALLCTSAIGQGNVWKKVRCNGGTVATKVDPNDWGNQLTITPEEIRLDLKDGQVLKIDPARVNSLSYGQEAHRRVGTMVALGVLIAPAALFGLFHKTKLHYIGLEYETAEGRKSGLLLQGHKDNYRAILQSLKSVTGKEVTATEEEKKK